MIEENKIALFDAYRNEEMPALERVAFKNRINKEPLLRLEYEEYLAIVQGIRQFERERLKQFLMESDAENIPTKVLQLQTKNRSIWAKIAVAAAILLLLIPTYNYFTFESRMVAKYEIEAIDDNTMGGENISARENFYRGIEFKKAGKSTEAIAAFEIITEEDINIYFLAQYEMALLEIENKNTEKAKSILQKLTQRTENHFIKSKSKQLLDNLQKSRFW